VSYVDCADIAACAAALVTGHGRPGETFVVTGPEALDHNEIAAKRSTVTGRRIDYVDVTPAELARRVMAMGAPEGFARDVSTLVAEVAAGALSDTTHTVAELTGKPARTFDEFVRDNAALIRRSWSSA
jgi:NAD(P)H dehydrogenase (quinone)